MSNPFVPMQIPTVYDYVKYYCDLHAQISYNGRIQLDGQPSTWKLLQKSIWLECIDTKNKIPESGIIGALEIYTHKQRLAFIQKHAEQLLAHKGDRDDGPIRAWLRAVTGKESPLDIAVLKHFIWQVKRKLRNLPTDYEMMPVVCGKTGSGKSQAVYKLIEPIKELAETGRDFNIFQDTREHYIFGQMYVVVLDEMARAQDVKAEAWKKIITAKDISYRGLFTQATVTSPMVSTFIGTSNNTISEIVVDTTSARRFWQIDSLDKCDWDTVNNLDYAKLWSCVDETAQCPVIPLWDEIQTYQHNYLRHKSPVEEWFLENWAVHPTTTTPASVAFQSFRDWSTENNIAHKLSSTRFGLELTRIPDVEKRLVKTGRVYNIAKLPTPAGAKGDVIPMHKVSEKP